MLCPDNINKHHIYITIGQGQIKSVTIGQGQIKCPITIGQGQIKVSYHNRIRTNKKCHNRTRENKVSYHNRIRTSKSVLSQEDKDK